MPTASVTFKAISKCTVGTATAKIQRRWTHGKACGRMNEQKEEFLCLRQDVVDKVTEKMPPDEILYDLAELFKAFGDTTRIRILYALFESELCVNDMAQLLGLSQTAVSHQLRVLKNNKLVKFRKEGKIVFYSLSDDHVRKIIEMGMEHVEE